MHIVDGALSTEVLLTGSALAAGGIAMGLRRLDMENIPATGMMAACFFVASLIHVPLGPSSVHLIMNGLAGLILGWLAFPALFIGLLLQAVFFGYGGVTVLGINTLAIALPAVLAHYILRHGLVSGAGKLTFVYAGAAGFGAIVLTGAIVSIILALSGEAFMAAAKLVIVAHLPVAIIEGVLCAFAITLILRVKPDVFGSLSLKAREARVV